MQVATNVGFSVLGIIIFALIAILIVGGLVALIAVLASRKNGNDDLSPVGDDGVLGDQRSYFDGGYFGYIGHQILYCLISVFSLGIAVPWAMCMMERWRVNHTVINGRRLKFTGTGGKLFGKYILGVILTIITFGIYGIWFGLSIQKWMTSHTVYADDPDETASKFTGGAGGWFGYHVLFIVLSLVTFGIGMPFAMVMLERWKLSNTVIGGSPLAFNGLGGRLFGKMLLWALLSVVTFGIFDLFVYVKYLRWVGVNTDALYRTEEYKKFSREQEKFALENVAAYGLAANNTELDKLRSGVKGDESPDEIKIMAQNGNIYASYIYACELINSRGNDDEEAIELLRTSAYGGYHQAMLYYAYYVKEYSEQEYIDLVKGSAKAGNYEASRILKEYYEALAYEFKNADDERCVDALREAAYWFKVAVSQGNYPNEDTTFEYEKMLDTIAMWKASGVEPKKGGAGVVVGAILGVIALVGVLGVGAFALLAIFGVSVPLLGSFGGHTVDYVDPTPYEDYVDDYDDYDYYDGSTPEEVTENTDVYVPYVTGFPESDAVSLIESVGLICEITYTETSDYTEGTVISSSYSDGDLLEKGSTVILEIAIAPQYPDLTRSRAFELVNNWNYATSFLYHYFESKGMIDCSNPYELAVFDGMQIVECGSVPCVNTWEDLRKALSSDFTYNYIDDTFTQTYSSDVPGNTTYAGDWFKADGTIYYVPNYGMGFYDMDINTMSMEEVGPGRYRVICNGGAPSPEYYGNPYEFEIVYDGTDGEYKIDTCNLT
ncbi:MAG: DUF898 family protein [Ruminococcaceae bacterium]|nr:DUF898 family protein [Oscillospiraceae bacterium]